MRGAAALDRSTTVQAVTLLALCAVAVAHQARWWDWCIEDAAISYAYARNFANGDGLVPFVGGERVEGYSNPTWVLLLAPFHAFGFDLFSVSRILEAMLCAFTIPVAWFIGREVDDRRDSPVPMLAAGLLAMSPQFAHWGQSGLENGLYGLLLGLGLLRLLVEAREGGPPWSALWFLLLGWTRPEAPLFVALAWGLRAAFTWDRDGWRGTAAWTGLVLGPSLALEALRLWYFAWPFPQTFYAKLEEKDKGWWVWEHKGGGWIYLRNWAYGLVWGKFLPIGLLGAWGHRQAGAVALATAAVGLPIAALGPTPLLLPLSLLLLWGVVVSATREADGRGRVALAGLTVGLLVYAGVEIAVASGWTAPKPPVPEWLKNAPVYALLSAMVFVPARALLDGHPARARATVAAFTSLGLLWCVISVGDWMKGFRWLSLCAVPFSVLLAAGIGEAGRLCSSLWRGGDGLGIPGIGIALALFLAPLPAAVENSNELAAKPDTSPFSVRERVEFVEGVRRRIGHTGPWVDFDVDMGAHMWWSPFELVDMAGLVDVPLAQHRFQRSFVSEYLFHEKRPHFLHVHGNWASTSKIPTYPEFKAEYTEIPGYPQGRSIHPGNHLRKDLLVRPAWPYRESNRVPFGDGIVLDGWRIGSPEVGRGRMFHLEVGMWTRTRKDGEDFRLLVFLHDGARVVSSWDVPLGFDWLLPHSWGPRDHFVGGYDLPLPQEVAEGRYGIGFAVVARDGSIVPAAPPEEGEDPVVLPDGAVVGGSEAVAALFARGEVRFDEALVVVTIDELSAVAKVDRETALRLASEGDCEAAEEHWRLAQFHRPQNRDWVAEHLARVSRAFASCWADRAVRQPGQAVEAIVAARGWDPRSEDMLAVAWPLADRLYAQGLQELDAGDPEVAYARFSAAVRAWPWHAWARRMAEEARSERLDLDPESRALQRQKDAKERADRRKHGSASAGGPDEEELPIRGGDEEP